MPEVTAKHSRARRAINYQVQQIQARKNQFEEFKHYESLFGYPKGSRAHHGPATRERPSQDGTRRVGGFVPRPERI